MANSVYLCLCLFFYPIYLCFCLLLPALSPSLYYAFMHTLTLSLTAHAHTFLSQQSNKQFQNARSNPRSKLAGCPALHSPAPFQQLLLHALACLQWVCELPAATPAHDTSRTTQPTVNGNAVTAGFEQQDNAHDTSGTLGSTWSTAKPTQCNSKTFNPTAATTQPTAIHTETSLITTTTTTTNTRTTNQPLLRPSCHYTQTRHRERPATYQGVVEADLRTARSFCSQRRIDHRVFGATSSYWYVIVLR